MSDITKLKEIELFKNVDEKILSALAPVFQEERVADGQTIFRENDAGDKIYFIYSGEVEIVKLMNKDTGASQSISSLGAGEFFGEMALFDKKPRSATVRAKGEVVLLELSCQDFHYFLENDAQVAVGVMGGMLATAVKRLRETDVGYATVYETGRLLVSGGGIDRTLSGVLDKIMEVIPTAQRGLIALWNEFSEMFELNACAGFARNEIDLQKNDVLIKWLKENKKRLLIGRHGEPAVFDQKALPDYCGKSCLVEPLVHREELLGFLILTSDAPALEISRSQGHLLAGIASQIAPVIANQKKVTEEENRRRLQRAKI